MGKLEEMAGPADRPLSVCRLFFLSALFLDLTGRVGVD